MQDNAKQQEVVRSALSDCARYIKERNTALFKTLKEDIQTVFAKDPAARSMAEVMRLILSEQDKLEERLKRLESSSGIETPKDELGDRRREIMRGFSQGGGI